MSWDELKRDGVIMGKPEPIYVEDGAALEFDTPSKKVEFWSDQLRPRASTRCRSTRRRPRPPEGFLPLVTGRAPVHTFSRTQTNPLLQGLMPENEVWVNAATAATAGLKNGQYVQLKNQDGVVSNRIRVKATQRIRPDCAVHGLRLRPHQQDAQERVPEGRERRRAQHALQ